MSDVDLGSPYGVTAPQMQTAENNIATQGGWLANGLNYLGLDGTSIADQYVNNAYGQLTNGTSQFYTSGLAGVPDLSQQTNANIIGTLNPDGTFTPNPNNPIQKQQIGSGQQVQDALGSAFKWANITLTQAVTVIVGLIAILAGLFLFGPAMKDSGDASDVVKVVSKNPELLA